MQKGYSIKIEVFSWKTTSHKGQIQSSRLLSGINEMCSSMKIPKSKLCRIFQEEHLSVFGI